MRAFLFADTLVRSLRWKGYPVRHVINITDVGHLTSDADAGDDKMEAAAAREGRSIWSIAARYTRSFKRDVSRLNIGDPSVWALATEHIPGMIEFARKIEAEHCYSLDDGLYFDVSTIPDYGRLARSDNDLRESRIRPVLGKRHQQDFAIWRKSAPTENRQMEWDSPWGRGAPGWHLECSVMSKQHLGLPFDIHTGGIDHREIHHPNEIAQNQAYRGCADTGARWWMHNNFLVEREGKMSKSRGEFLRLQALVDRGFHPLSYRMMCLQAHYRSEMEFSWDGISAAQTRLRRIAKHVETIRLGITGQYAKTKIYNDENGIFDWRRVTERGSPLLRSLIEQFDEAISSDLNTPEAVIAFESGIKSRDLSVSEKYVFFKVCARVLGFDVHGFSRRTLRARRPVEAQLTSGEVDAIVRTRRILKRRRSFHESDLLRMILEENSVEVMDGDPLGWDWKV